MIRIVTNWVSILSDLFAVHHPTREHNSDGAYASCGQRSARRAGGGNRPERRRTGPCCLVGGGSMLCKSRIAGAGDIHDALSTAPARNA